MTNIAWMDGEIISNKVKGASNFSDSTSLHKIPVPTGKRWVLFGGCVNRDASQALDIIVYDADDDPVYFLDNDSAATGLYPYPPSQQAELTMCAQPFILLAGWYISFSFGGAQGAAATISAVVLELPE